MKHLSFTSLLAGMVLTSASLVSASVIQTMGAGSAVSTATNSAYFELNTGMNSGYVEDGMVFSYTGSSNNNGCGYAGCGYHNGFYPGFSGNYMYSVGTGTYVSAKMADGSDFTAIEFSAGSGYSLPINGKWETYNDAVLTGSGIFTINSVPVLGLVDMSGMDEVRYFTSYTSDFSYSAPAFDNVHIGGATSAVPEPSSFLLFGGALLGLGLIRRKRK